MSDLTIAPNIPATILALSQDELDRALELAEQAHHVALPDVEAPEFLEAFGAANRLYQKLNIKSKALNAGRLEWVRRLDAVKKELNESVRAATEPLEDQRAKLGTKLAAAQDAQLVCYERKKREAEIEARRLEIEAYAAAEHAREEEAKRRVAETPPWEDVQPLEPFDGKNIVRPVEPAFVPTPPKAAVFRRTDRVLEIVDRAIIPLEMEGTPLWQPDEKQIEKILRAGIAVPGCRLVEVVKTVSRRNLTP